MPRYRLPSFTPLVKTGRESSLRPPSPSNHYPGSIVEDEHQSLGWHHNGGFVDGYSSSGHADDKIQHNDYPRTHAAEDASSTPCGFTEDTMLASGADPPGYHFIDWRTDEDIYQPPPYSVGTEAQCFSPGSVWPAPQPLSYESGAPRAYQEPAMDHFWHGAAAALSNGFLDIPLAADHGAYPFWQEKASPEPVYSDAAAQLSLDEAMSSLSLNTVDPGLWTIRQDMYRGNKGNHQADIDQVLAITVDVAAEDALHPDVLAEVLENPLGTAFEDPNESRKRKKFTLRYVFPDMPPNRAQQIHEYSSGHQRSETVKAAISRLPRGSHRATAASVPLMRAAVVEKVAWGLYKFMEELSAAGQPLQFRGRDVDYGHLQIVKIIRPTLASMQPVLEIAPRYRQLYPPTTQVSEASPGQPEGREDGGKECHGWHAYYGAESSMQYGADFSTYGALF